MKCSPDVLARMRKYYRDNKAAICVKQKAYRLANAEKIKEDHRKYTIECRDKRAAYSQVYKHRKYGITKEQYDMMLQMKGGGCWICGAFPKSRRLAIEHDHQTGRVRGLVCHNCNRNFIGKNNAGTARRVLAYLEDNFDGRLI